MHLRHILSILRLLISSSFQLFWLASALGNKSQNYIPVLSQPAHLLILMFGRKPHMSETHTWRKVDAHSLLLACPLILLTVTHQHHHLSRVGYISKIVERGTAWTTYRPLKEQRSLARKSRPLIIYSSSFPLAHQKKEKNPQ